MSLSSETSFIFMTSFLCPLCWQSPSLSLYYFLDYRIIASKVMPPSTYFHSQLHLTQSYKISHLKHSLGHSGLLFKIHPTASHQILNGFLKLAFRVPFTMYWVDLNGFLFCSSKGGRIVAISDGTTEHYFHPHLLRIPFLYPTLQNINEISLYSPLVHFLWFLC